MWAYVGAFGSTMTTTQLSQIDRHDMFQEVENRLQTLDAHFITDHDRPSQPTF